MLQTILYILCTTLELYVYFLQSAMLLRALLSFFPAAQESPLAAFLYLATEPAILPVRVLLAKLGVGEDSPIDMSFTFTALILMILPAFLPTISL